MAKEIYGIRGQVKPAINNEEVLYTAPSKRSSIVKVTAFNENASSGAAIKIAIVPDGGATPAPATAPENYLVNGLPVGSKNDLAGGVVNGITLDEFDQIRVESDNADTVFHCYGVEIEP